MAMAVFFNSNVQLIIKCTRSPVNLINEGSAMMSRDLPTASFRCKLTTITKVEVRKKPPPAPSRPVIKPMTTPYNESR